MRAGIKVSDECIALFNHQRTGGKIKFMILKFSDDGREIVLKDKADEGATYTFDDFLERLPQNEVCFAYYGYSFRLENENSTRSRTILLSWVPDAAPARHKMMLATSSTTLKNALPGVVVSVRASSLDDITEDILRERCLEHMH